MLKRPGTFFGQNVSIFFQLLPTPWNLAASFMCGLVWRRVSCVGWCGEMKPEERKKNHRARCSLTSTWVITEMAWRDRLMSSACELAGALSFTENGQQAWNGGRKNSRITFI